MITKKQQAKPRQFKGVSFVVMAVGGKMMNTKMNINRINSFKMKKILLSIILLLSLISLSSYSQNKKTPMQRTYGIDAMSRVDELPLLFPNGTETKQFISYDPTGGNYDHHFLSAFTKYIDSTKTENGAWEKEYVIFDAAGPGCLYRQQMNTWANWNEKGEHVRLLNNNARCNANIRYYFDNETRPRIDMSVSELFGAEVKPYNGTLAFFDPLARFSILYYPFTFQKRLKVAIRPNGDDYLKTEARWYQYTYLALSPETAITTWKEQETDNRQVRDQWSKNGDNPNDIGGCRKITRSMPIRNGESKAIFEIQKKGSLAGIKIKLNPYSIEIFFNTQIKIYWDENPEAAVDLPLSYLFGGGAKDYIRTASFYNKDIEETQKIVFGKSLSTLFYGYNKEEGSLYTYWPMPFWKSARIVLENHSGVDLSELTCEVWFKPAGVANYSPEKTGYFCAKRTPDAATDSIDYRAHVFDEKGRGHVVGIMFYTDKFDVDGDEFTYIDDSQTPQIHGDGSEDDHNQGWSGDAFQKPLWGGVINGYQGGYRTYMNDCYVFNKNISINYEYSLCSSKDGKGGGTDITVFYYKANGNGNLLLTDEVDVGNNYSEKLHQYQISRQTWKGILNDEYDGYERNLQYGACADDGRAFNGSSKFEVKIDPSNDGVRLRKRINRNGNGVQTAEVFVDGIKVAETLWHIVTPSKSTGKDSKLDGWLDSDFEIPDKYTKDKSKIFIEVKYAGSPMKKEINEFYYWVYSYKN